MANATYITGTETVLAHIRKQLKEEGAANDVEFDYDGDHYAGRVSGLIERERDGEIELFGKVYSGSEFQVPVSDMTDLTIFDYADALDIVAR